MADVDINDAGIRSWELDGGTIAIVDSSNDNHILNVVTGTLRVRFAYRPPVDPATDTDRGELPAKPRRGAEQAGEIDLDVKWTGEVDAASVIKVLTAEDTSSEFMSTFGIEIEWPDYEGASTGTVFTATNCYCREAPEIGVAADMDTLSVRLQYTKAPTIASY